MKRLKNAYRLLALDAREALQHFRAAEHQLINCPVFESMASERTETPYQPDSIPLTDHRIPELRCPGLGRVW